MIEKVKLENGVHEVQMNNSNGFKYLNLTSAQITGTEYFKEIPSVEMILLNDQVMFTCYSNLIPGTNSLNCFELLLTAANIPALMNEKFHTLTCRLPEQVINKSIAIDLEFEIE